MWIGTNNTAASACNYLNTNCYWQNSSQFFTNVTNSTSPVGAVIQTINHGLPWFWPLFPFVLYIWLLSMYSDSPGRGKLFMIAALVFIISAFMALGSFITGAVINFVIFIIAFIIAGLFNKNTTVGG